RVRVLPFAYQVEVGGLDRAAGLQACCPLLDLGLPRQEGRAAAPVLGVSRQHEAIGDPGGDRLGAVAEAGRPDATLAAWDGRRHHRFPHAEAHTLGETLAVGAVRLCSCGCAVRRGPLNRGHAAATPETLAEPQNRGKTATKPQTEPHFTRPPFWRARRPGAGRPSSSRAAGRPGFPLGRSVPTAPAPRCPSWCRRAASRGLPGAADRSSRSEPGTWPPGAP